MEQITIKDLKIVDGFEEVPDVQLQWLIDKGKVENLQEGERIFDVGDPIDKLFIILEGKARICILQNGQLRNLVTYESGSVTGYLPFSRATFAVGFCECLKPSKIFTCSRDFVKECIIKHYELTEALVHMMTSRIREATTFQQQNEKMFALGKLSAGLAHELNNPAAAITRAASLLQKQVDQLPVLFKEVSLLRIGEEKIDKIQALLHFKINNNNAQFSMLEKARREGEIEDWIYDNKVENIDTEGLADLDFTIDDLDTIKVCSQTGQLGELNVVLEWIGNYLVTNKMAEDIRASSERISNLVGAVKNFTFMDQASDKQLTDIHSGINNTLTMLNYKLKKGNIEVIQNYDESLPKVNAMPGGLNQIWTNLIDNAIDAMEPNQKGTLEIKTVHEASFVKVYIKDNGSGIPKDIQPKIFDPFFTTKEMGKGSGLGLDVVNKIINQHNGSVKLFSEPGTTEFEVCLPIDN